MDKKEIQKFIQSARCDNDASFDMIEKNAFTEMLTGLKIKILSRSMEKGYNEEMEKQLSSLTRMEKFMERLTFKNCVFHFQAKTILSQDVRIVILEQEKIDLIKSKAAIIERAKTKVQSLEAELKTIKKRIKNDKESI